MWSARVRLPDVASQDWEKMELLRNMQNDIIKSRENAKLAIMRYAMELNKAGYNDRCIQDSLVVMALDVAFKRV